PGGVPVHTQSEVTTGYSWSPLELQGSLWMKGGQQMSVDSFEQAKKQLSAAREATIAAGRYLLEQQRKLSGADFDAALKGARISQRAAKRAMRRAGKLEADKSTKTDKAALKLGEGQQPKVATKAEPKVKSAPAKVSKKGRQ